GRNDFGLAMTIHVGDDRQFVRRPGTLRQFVEYAAVGSVVDSQVMLVTVNDLCLAVSIKIKYGRAGNRRTVILGRLRPLDRSVRVKDRILASAGDADLGLAIAIHVGHGGRSRVVVPSERRGARDGDGAPLDRAIVGEQVEIPIRDLDDLGVWV